ncbi:SAVED domain-containing protein [Microtetraspora sp. AC03309]|uniref:SAVED domain-containing protein n=1 Tax=Microtetraspora sp. AC03309 TaxID=2779376 RepID=UPI001E2BD9CA|nr:SAVED domain-containing protein [Microtetraspora sp. AC03309]
MTERTIRLGELAHIVGQQKTPGSPRGEHDLEERDTADNLMLVCADEHDEVDARETLNIFTVEKLQRIKQAHEDRIRHVTGIAADNTTTVLRMVGRVRGREVELTRQTAAAAVIASADRFPLFLESYSRHGLEIDLRHVLGEAKIDLRDVPGEETAGRDYYRMATDVINDVIEHQLNRGLARDQIAHLSVFGFARLPLLVYLGAHLDDTVPTDIYQRHRHDETWKWSDDAPKVAFNVHVDRDEPPTDEAVLILNISGTIQPEELPARLGQLRRYRISPINAAAAPDVMRHRGSLANFQNTVRSLFSNIEASSKEIRCLHVMPALPLSAAVSLGRVHDRQVHPKLRIYDRTPTGYHCALEIS